MARSILPSGNAFNGKSLRGTRPISSIGTKTNYVSLTAWCQENFISKKIGRRLIAKKLLIAQRLYGQWWVRSNPACLEELLDYLGIEQLFFDASDS